MQYRRIGDALEVSAVGLGCMTMTGDYGAGDEAEAIATIHRAIALGVNFLDTADAYGRGRNEALLGRALKGRRDAVVVATKFGPVRDADDRPGINGRSEYVAQACDASLERLGVDVIDLYYLHRVDRATPIEDTVGAMARLVEQGKVRCLGLSEAAPAPSTPSPRFRANTRSGPAMPRPRCCQPAPSLAFRSSPSAPLAEGSSPAP